MEPQLKSLPTWSTHGGSKTSGRRSRSPACRIAGVALCGRFPWQRLPDVMCFRDLCSSDRDCCRRFNICDRSARVCVDCWYGSSCRSERDCCLKYPNCDRDDPNDVGKCTNEP